MGTGTHIGVDGTAMRPRRLRLVAVLVVLATAIVALAIGLSRSDAGQPPAPSAMPATSAFAGIGQDGITLGSPEAPATLIEYADVQCPFCAVYAKTVLPTVVDRYVRTGRVKLELHVLAFLGQDSVKAARGLAAAAQQERFWELSEQLFARQGAENTGWVTDELLRDAMAQTAGLDVERAWIATGSPAAARLLARAERSARSDRIAGTPSHAGTSPTGDERHSESQSDPTADSVNASQLAADRSLPSRPDVTDRIQTASVNGALRSSALVTSQEHAPSGIDPR